jgi:hypothetical protein
MGEYPRSWNTTDLSGAARVFGEHAQVIEVHEHGRGDADAAIELAIDGYSAWISEKHQLYKHHLTCFFVVPPHWPLFAIKRVGDSGISGDEASWQSMAPIGSNQYEVLSPAPAQASTFLALGVAQAVLENPLRTLRIDPTGAAILTRSGARFNAETAGWLCSLMQVVLRGAPPFATLDLIVDPPGFAATRAAWLRDELSSADALLDEPIAAPTAQLQATIASWCSELDRLDREQRSGAVEPDQASAAVSEMLGRWTAQLAEASGQGADPELVTSVEDVFAERGSTPEER